MEIRRLEITMEEDRRSGRAPKRIPVRTHECLNPWAKRDLERQRRAVELRVRMRSKRLDDVLERCAHIQVGA